MNSLFRCTLITAFWAVGCAQTPSKDSTFDLGLTFSNLTDGGVARTDGGALLYGSGGAFSVDITATVSPKGLVDSRTPPLHATVQLDETSTPVGATAIVMTQLLPQSDGRTFFGSAPVVWPPGGSVHVRVSAAGYFDEQVVSLDVPRLSIQRASSMQLGTQLLLPFCVRSSTLNGAVAVHLDRATFLGTSNASDVTAMLTPGDCAQTDAVADSVTFGVHSHAQLVGLPAVDLQTPPYTVSSVAITATLQNSSPPIFAYDGDAGVSPGFALIALFITAPLNNTRVAPGTQVTLHASATYVHGDMNVPAADVPVSYQSTESGLSILPTSSVTDSAGMASATFLMPNLDGGVLVVDPIGGIDNTGVTLTN
jgi:hypothetical protein